MSDLHIVILAAGKGTRMKSAEPKVLHRAGGLALIDHVLRAAGTLQPSTIVIVVGHQADRIEDYVGQRPGVRFARQEPQLGTGHALLQAEPHLAGATGTVVLLSGDVPLLRPDTLAGLVRHHTDRGATATVVTARVPDPTGYGRIVRDGGDIVAIVEEKDATAAERAIDEINSGIYAFELGPLFGALRSVGSANAQGEYYLPDLVGIYRERRLTVETFTLGARPGEAREILGVNSRRELADVSAILKANRAAELMDAGVTIVDPASTWIGPDVPSAPTPSSTPTSTWKGARRSGPAAKFTRASASSTRRSRTGSSSTTSACSSNRTSPPARRSDRSRSCGRSRTSARTRTSATSSSSRTRGSAKARRRIISPISATPPLAKR